MRRQASKLYRVFYIDGAGHTSSALYYVKVSGKFYRVNYTEYNTYLHNLNCLDAMRVQTFDVDSASNEVIKKYGVISLINLKDINKYEE